jgi:prefoldin subunit 1
MRLFKRSAAHHDLFCRSISILGRATADGASQLVQEIETQAILAQQQINVVKSQMAGKQREIRLLQLTSSEVSTLPRDTPLYEGVGKM